MSSMIAPILSALMTELIWPSWDHHRDPYVQRLSPAIMVATFSRVNCRSCRHCRISICVFHWSCPKYSWNSGFHWSWDGTKDDARLVVEIQLFTSRSSAGTADICFARFHPCIGIQPRSNKQRSVPYGHCYSSWRCFGVNDHVHSV
jgi:hypothetical protein